MEEKKQLVLVVESTAALCPHWETIVSDYLEIIIRKFCGNEATEAPSSVVELALVQFNAHESYNSCLVQRSGWVRNVDYFLEWLSCMHFSGGGFCDAATAEGLAEVLMICTPPNGTQTQPTDILQRHCILVAASNPYTLPTTVYQTPNKSEMQLESRLSDAETIAKSFPQSRVSLSVICPKQLPKLKSIYNAGKRNPTATTPTINIVKNPHYLILISKDFMEACAALSPSGITNMEFTSTSTVSEPPPTSVSSVNESLLTQQPVSVRNIPMATVKVEPSTVLPVALAGTMMAAPGMSQQVQGMHFNRVNSMETNVGLSQQTLNAPRSGRTKYVKLWEGELGVMSMLQNQIDPITRLEAYRRLSSAESLAEDWPSTLLMDKLFSLDHLKSKQNIGKCDFIVFRALNQHRLLGQMKDKNLCAVIRLPSQQLLLSVSNKAFRLIAMLLPVDMVLFKPHIPSQQLSPQQQRAEPGTSQGAGDQTQLVGASQGQVSSPGPKPKQEPE